MPIPNTIEFRRCDFQLSCIDCFESIVVDQVHVLVDVNGKPLKAEARRVFRRKPFNKFKECPCCGSKHLEKSFLYECRNIESGEDLPF